MIAVHDKDQIIEPIEYDLYQTSCQCAIKYDSFTVETVVQEEFPNDRLLADMAVNGYVGIALKRSAGSAVDLIAALYKNLVKNVEEIHSLLKTFALRASIELERLHAEIKLHRYEHIVAHSSGLLAFVKTDYSIQSVNPAFRSVLQFKATTTLMNHRLTAKTGKFLVKSSNRISINVLTGMKPVQNLYFLRPIFQTVTLNSKSTLRLMLME